MNTVTKPKNPGRVAAGKRTAEINRKRKEELLRNQKTVPSEKDSGPEGVPEGPESSQAYKYGGGAVIAVALGIAVFILWKRDLMQITFPPTVQQPENDIFRMN